MIPRRTFLQSSLYGGASLLGAGSLLAAESPPLSYDLSLDVPARLYDGEKCWCHPRAGVVPGAGRRGKPRIVMTMNTMHVSGSDVFKAMFSLKTDDLGNSWTAPTMQDGLAIRTETIDGVARPIAVSDFWPAWHADSQTLLGTGHSVVYTPDWKVKHPRPRHTTYSTYDPQQNQWTAWKKLAMPAGDKFANSGAGCTQRVDLADGSLLLPIYFSPPKRSARVTVARCTFDGSTLAYVEHGAELAVDDDTRGLHEPSLTRFGDRFFLTIRNDQRGFVTRSDDGLHYEPIRAWKFDDGSDLGNYNTQQHWVTHSDGLFLAYTRRGANNDHVVRHRAPLFMAQVDPERLCVLRDSERILVPERGARLGNFGVTTVNQDETWVTVAEWMQDGSKTHVMPVDNKYGSDGSVFVARIRWNRPNRLA